MGYTRRHVPFGIGLGANSFFYQARKPNEDTTVYRRIRVFIGAVGLEMVGAYAWINLYKNWYLLASTTEEILEMSGAIILLHAVTSQLFFNSKNL